MSQIFLAIIFGILLLPAIGLVFVPLFPAFWYMISVAAIFGVIDGFAHLSLANLGVLGILFLLSIAVDWSAGMLGAKWGGAGWKSMLYGVVGAFIGLIIFPPLGVFAGLFMGVFIGEFLRHNKTDTALRAARGALLGAFTGMILNALLAFIFVILFFVFAF